MCEAAQGLQPTGMVVGVDEQLQMRPWLFVGLIPLAFDCRVLEGAVHPLDLTLIHEWLGFVRRYSMPCSWRTRPWRIWP